MIAVHNSYPFFEANQVLTNENLNQLFNYLEEQTRLTRTNLIGIGIVCGFTYRVENDGSAIYIRKGVGVSSEGYLISDCENSARLDYRKPYTVPDDINYPVFFDNSGAVPQQYPLWELDSDQNDNPDAVPLSLNFLTGTGMPAGMDDEKVLILFLECLAIDNKNCSPNSCDDKGKVIETTVRRLLIRRSDLDAIQEEVMDNVANADEYFGLTGIMNLRNSLPELRMRRFDVPATTLLYSSNVFDAFQATMNASFINQVAIALRDLYEAFEPILQSDFAANPFNNLSTQWAFLHNGGIITQNKHFWMQYFFDHIFTVIQAYNEFRDRGLEIIGLCCPPGGLFPRHLMLGIALPDADNPAYRTHFTPSPIFSKYICSRDNLIILFRRLVILVEQLELPPAFSGNDNNQFPIQITPSKLGPYPLSTRAIPFHYQPVPLYEYWDPYKTRQLRADLNLGYRSPSWNSTDDFVLNPLRYDYEENSFYRIEGHVGLPYQLAMSNILDQRNANRLPFDVIALRTGRNSEGVDIPSDIIECSFQDLEAIYDTLRENLLCQLCHAVQYFYDTVMYDEKGETVGDRNSGLLTPTLPALQNCAPNYRYRNGTVGEVAEQLLPQLLNVPYANIDQNNPFAVFGAYFFMAALMNNNTENVPAIYAIHLVYIYYIAKLSETLTEDLSGLDLEEFVDRYEDLVSLVDTLENFYTNLLADNNPENPDQTQVDWDEFQDQLVHLMTICNKEPIQALHEEYQRRLQEIKDKYLLSFFARQHPGIEHKAGVPRGGTFILVYHGEDESKPSDPIAGRFPLTGRVTANGESLMGVTLLVAGTSTGTATDIDGSFSLTVYSLPATLRVSYTGFPEREYTIISAEELIELDLVAPTRSTDSNKYPNLVPGRVIADFYLPYNCNSNCQPIVFQLPAPALTVAIEQIGCTEVGDSRANIGTIQVTPAAGVAPYQYSLDGGTIWLDLVGDTIRVTGNAEVIIRDAEGTRTTPQMVSLKDPLSIVFGERVCNEEGTAYELEVFIHGGTPPYNLTINGQTTTVNDGNGVRIDLESGQEGDLLVTDSSETPCETNAVVESFECPPLNTCNLPCKGITRTCDYLFWMQPPLPLESNNSPYINVELNVYSFKIGGILDENDPPITKTFNADELGNITDILNTNIIEFPDQSTFDSIWSENVEAANKYIQAVLAETFGAVAGPIMTWSYESNEHFSFLKLETYDCFTFEFTINVKYATLKGGALEYDRTTTCTNAGALVVNQARILNGDSNEVSSTGSVPPLNCILRDRCQDDSPVIETMCQTDLLSPDISLEPTGNGRITIGTFTNDAVEVYMEVHNTMNMIANGNNNTFQLPIGGDIEDFFVNARVLVFSSDTCTNAASELFNF